MILQNYIKFSEYFLQIHQILLFIQKLISLDLTFVKSLQSTGQSILWILNQIILAI